MAPLTELCVPERLFFAGVRAALAEVCQRNLQVARLQDKDGNAEVCLQALLHLAEVYWQVSTSYSYSPDYCFVAH